MIIDGVRYENITCPRCRFRHPAHLSCKVSRAYAEDAREKHAELVAERERKEQEFIDSLGDSSADTDNLESGCRCSLDH